MGLAQEPLREVLTELARTHRVVGAALAVRHDGRTIPVTTGEEELGTGREVTARTTFPLGSLTKPFTATLAMALVDEGDVDLDAPLAEWVPELGPPGPGTAERITLRRILCHTSGLASAVDEANENRETSRKRWVARHCREADVVHTPGTAFSYSNVGYALAGHLIEVVTGLSWPAAMESIVLTPLGVEPAAGRSLATGHTVRAARERVVPVPAAPPRTISAPNGGLALHATDLVALACEHMADPARLLTPGSAAAMREDQLVGVAVGSFGMAHDWGLGWAVYRDQPAVWYGHDGTGDGTSCHLRFEPGSGTAVALTTNTNTGTALWEDLVAHLRESGLPVGNYSLSTLPEAGAPVSGPPECAGRYVNGDMEFPISLRGDELYLMAGAQPYARLTCFQGLAFTLHEVAGGSTVHTGRFLRDGATGSVDLIQVTGRLARRSTPGSPR